MIDSTKSLRINSPVVDDDATLPLALMCGCIFGGKPVILRYPTLRERRLRRRALVCAASAQRVTGRLPSVRRAHRAVPVTSRERGVPLARHVRPVLLLQRKVALHAPRGSCAP